MITWWLKISRAYTVYLPKDRPFTRLEAAYSIALDADNEKTGTLRGYATLWGWNHHRVKRFLEEIDMLDRVIKNNQNGVPLASQSCPTDVPQEHNKNIEMQGLVSHSCPTDVPPASRTIKNRKEVNLFDQFWSAYPRKTGKALALKIWERLNPSKDTATAILTALDWQRQQPDWQKDGGRFIPYPSTWLNGRRWEDERPAQPTPARSAAAPGGSSLEDLRAKGIDI